VQVLDRKERQFRTKTISVVKILWQNHGLEEASLELEQGMRVDIPICSSKPRYDHFIISFLYVHLDKMQVVILFNDLEFEF